MKAKVVGLLTLIALVILVVAPATAQTFDNSGGGEWKEYMSFPITTIPTEYAQYRIVINETTWEIYNASGGLEATGTNDNFWSLVQSDGDDIRVFNQSYSQLYFWIELFDYTNKTATIWVNVTPNSTELNIAYGNLLANASRYHNGEKTFYAFDDFDIRLARYVITGHTRGVEKPQTFRLFVSTDGLNWREIPNINYTGLPEGDSVRDPSIIRYNGRWWIVHTAQAFDNYQDHFDVAVSDDLINWTFVTKVDCSSITGGRQGGRVWAPEFFIDDDGSVHVYVAIHSGLSGDHFKIYEVHPLDENMTTWSEPVEVFSISGIDVIDPFMVKINGTYYLWYKDETNKYIEYAIGTTPTGNFIQQTNDDWAGWGSYREGMSLIKINETTWRLYIDFYSNADPTGIYYSESSDGFQTWTPPKLVIVDVQHPTITDVTSVNHHSDEAMAVEEEIGFPWIVKRNGGLVKYENGMLKIGSSDAGTHINAKIAGGLQNVLIRTKVKVINNGEAYSIGVTDGTVSSDGNFYNGYTLTFNGWAFELDRQRITVWSAGTATALNSTAEFLLENGSTYITSYIYSIPTLKMFKDNTPILEASDNTYPSCSHLAIQAWSPAEYWVYWVIVAKLVDSADFGTPTVKYFNKTYITEIIPEIHIDKGVCLKISWHSPKYNLSELTFEIDLDGDGTYEHSVIGNDYICLGIIPARTYKIIARVVAPDGNYTKYTKTIMVTYPRPIVGASNVINASGIVIWTDKGGNLSYAEIKPIKMSQNTFTVIINHENIYANETGDVILNVTIFGLAGGDKIWLNETVARARTVDLLHNGEPLMVAIPVENNSVNLTLTMFSTYTLVVNNTVAPPKIAPPEEMTITELLIFVGIAVGLVAVVAGAIYLAKRTKAKTLARMESEFRFFRRLK